ncbi:MAG: hypothetical protein IKL80_04680, partial [Clostridia bacterium]|nr:hypothetical protein [Clostridia bacterium]
VSEAGTATSENSKIGDLNESEILKNTEIIAQRAESDIVRRAEPAPNKSANPQTADFHTESVTEAGAKDVTNDTFQDAETLLPSESPVAPLMTAALPADETMPAVEADTKQVMKASGGGSSARTAMHEAETPYIHYYFSQEGIETARALLEAYQQSDGVYVLSQVTAQKLHSALAEVSGFVRSESIGHSDEETSEIRIVLHVVA